MAVGLKEAAQVLSVAGLRLGSAAAGIRYQGRDDLVLIELKEGSQAAAVFTRNAFRAAPVQVASEHLSSAPPRYLIINSGNANAGTGRQGLADARACCAAVAAQAGCRPEDVLPFSTGVIGEPLPVTDMATALPQAMDRLSGEGWREAARAIMTTDTVPKLASREFSCGERFCNVTGMAKGAGMIRPDMATMLSFIGTDAAVRHDVLQACLAKAVSASFNRITIDGDTSTNDSCVLMATGAAGNRLISDPMGEDYDSLELAVTEICVELAQAVVRDGEGATRFVTVEVGEGRDEEECLGVAYTLAHSPLVKTALFAGDPNWGRILAAVGRAGLAELSIDAVRIFLGEVCIVEGGGRAPDYSESRGQAAMAGEEITIRVLLGRGDAAATVWTSDLSYDYVKINAEYRT